MIKANLLILAILLIAGSPLFAQTQVPENSSSPIYYKDGKIGIRNQHPVSSLHIYESSEEPSYPSVNSRGDVFLFSEACNNALEIGNSRGFNARRAWILARHSSNSYFMHYSTLHLQPDVGSKSYYKGVAIGFPATSTLSTGTHLAVNGKTGINTNSPQADLHIHHGDGMTAYLRLESELVSQNASVQFCSQGVYRWELGTGISAQSAFELYDRTDGVCRMVVLDDGNVGIGTISPDYKLDVNGTIRTRELKVDMQGADFVFEDDYNLRSLNDLEEFIQSNKHLPDVAPAKEMQENGVNQSEMNQKLLQKIEELTLYVIQQQKEISQLKAKEEKISELEKSIDSLNQKLSKLK